MLHWTPNGQYLSAEQQNVYVDRPQMQTVPYPGVNYYPDIFPPQTAVKMMALALQAVVDPNIASLARWLVKDLIDENEHPFASVYSEIQAIYNWVKGHVRYTRDPVGVELVYSPQRLLQLIGQYGSWSEDCDTQLLMCLTLLLALGRNVRLTIAGFNVENPNDYSHVFIEVMVPPIPNFAPMRWVIVDPTTPGKTNQMAADIKYYLHFSP